MKRLAVFGASGHGKVVADAAEHCGWVVSFYDDNRSIGDNVSNWSILGTFRDLLAQLEEYDGVIVGIGNNSIRFEKSEVLLSRGAPLVNVIHPEATISRYVQLNVGTVVMAGAVINVDTQLGLACIVNTGATIDHDCYLGDGVHVSPGAHLAGEVRVGDLSWVGIGSVVRQQITIGANAMIAAGAAVVKDVSNNVTVSGVPATEMR